MVLLNQYFGFKPWELGCTSCRPGELCHGHFWAFADAADQLNSEQGSS